ncbi:hypothetical protein GOBAR_AA08569 [Gossypium barbadense]|uniref:Uncharacterized protein n=1 Tax=Gossypium barbadense TaxID=3634 RepID=A0A2P5Y921_GOSBA|nr:hypothetical protein GOBAR_AA08569 [Gossypium barbadense]
MRVQTRTDYEHFCIFSFFLSATSGLGFEVNDMLNHLRRLTKTKAKDPIMEGEKEISREVWSCRREEEHGGGRRESSAIEMYRSNKTRAKEILSWKERKRSAVKCGVAVEENTAEEEEKVAPLKCDWRLLPN